MSLDVEVNESARKRKLASDLTSRPAGHVPGLIVVVAFVLYAVRLFRLISRYAVNIFFSDQWEFNDATLFQKHTLWQMFAWQHGPHRQGLAALFAKLIEPHFQWNSRIESFLAGGIVLTAALCALWLKKRLYGPLSLSDVVIPAILFTPAQWETLYITPNYAHGPFPLLLILLYCLAWTCERNLVTYPLVLLINFLAVYTGFGFFVGVLTPILLVVDHWVSVPERQMPRTYFRGALIISLASLCSFFIGYKLNADLDCFSPRPQSPGSYVAFAALMFANFFAVQGLGVAPGIFGMAILSVVLIALATVGRQSLRTQTSTGPNAAEKKHLISAALIAFSLLFCVGAGYGRLCGGLAFAQMSRYAIYLEPALLGVYFHLLSIRPATKRKLLLTGFAVPVLVASLHVDRRAMKDTRDAKLRWKACYVQIEDIKKCDQIAGFPVFFHAPERTHLQEKLQYLKRTRQNLYLDAK
jgi:hypothetical protein